jgi:hypothetical protein
MAFDEKGDHHAFQYVILFYSFGDFLSDDTSHFILIFFGSYAMSSVPKDKRSAQALQILLLYDHSTVCINTKPTPPSYFTRRGMGYRSLPSTNLCKDIKIG